MTMAYCVLAGRATGAASLSPSLPPACLLRITASVHAPAPLRILSQSAFTRCRGECWGLRTRRGAGSHRLNGCCSAHLGSFPFQIPPRYNTVEDEAGENSE